MPVESVRPEGQGGVHHRPVKVDVPKEGVGCVDKGEQDQAHYNPAAVRETEGQDAGTGGDIDRERGGKEHDGEGGAVLCGIPEVAAVPGVVEATQALEEAPEGGETGKERTDSAPVGHAGLERQRVRPHHPHVGPREAGDVLEVQQDGGRATELVGEPEVAEMHVVERGEADATKHEKEGEATFSEEGVERVGNK